MTPTEAIAALRALDAARTRGPWTWTPQPEWHESDDCEGGVHDHPCAAMVFEPLTVDLIDFHTFSEENAAFIVAALNALPALLDVAEAALLPRNVLPRKIPGFRGEWAMVPAEDMARLRAALASLAETQP